MPRIRAPTRRECTRCGRRERWDDDAGHWRIADSEGDVYCVHAWDVTGSFTAVEDDEEADGKETDGEEKDGDGPVEGEASSEEHEG